MAMKHSVVHCCWDVAALEARLSDAVSASLRVVADERPSFIALSLLGKDTSSATPLTEHPTDQQLEGELALLALLLRDAVNCAARHAPDEPPLENIAAFIIQSDEAPESPRRHFHPRACSR